MRAERFIDTNVLLYFAAKGEKANRAEAVVADGGVISVQVLNEVASDCRRKFNYDWERVAQALTYIRALIEVVPLTVETHELGLAVARDYRLAIYDAMLIASALLAGCDTFLSEDLHNGLVVDGRLTVRNPFA